MHPNHANICCEIKFIDKEDVIKLKRSVDL